MKITESLRVEKIYDAKHGTRFQVLVINKEKTDPVFTIHRDIMGREYMKLKLDNAEIMALIQELTRQVQQPEPPKLRSKPSLTLVEGDEK